MSSRKHPTRTVVWSSRALFDLEAIADFIATDKPAAAERWITKLMSAAERAARMPFAGRRVPELGRDDVREILKARYRIVYRVAADRIEILTVFEGHRHLPTKLED